MSRIIPGVLPELERIIRKALQKSAADRYQSAREFHIDLRQLARRHPDCQAVTVEGQGHAPLLETGALPKIIRDFIGRVEQKMPH